MYMPDLQNQNLIAQLGWTSQEKDLHRHIHIENNILFPKALKLESELLNSKGA
jgi:hemerythrin-like domain-containing protein